MCTSLFADDKFLPISEVNVAGGAMILDLSPNLFIQNQFLYYYVAYDFNFSMH